MINTNLKTLPWGLYLCSEYFYVSENLLITLSYSRLKNDQMAYLIYVNLVGRGGINVTDAKMFSCKFKGFKGKTFAFCLTATLTAIGAAAAQSVRYWATRPGSSTSHRPKYINTIKSETSKGALEQTTKPLNAQSTRWEQLPYSHWMCLYVHAQVSKNISPSWTLIKYDSSPIFEHWWQVTYHSCSCSSHRFSHSFLPSYIYSDLHTFKHTVKSFFKEMISITFYLTFPVWAQLEKTSLRRHIFQCQQEGYLHLAPCSGDCSGPLENLDWILWQDPHSIHGERSVFRRKKRQFIKLFI